jgi:integrase
VSDSTKRPRCPAGITPRWSKRRKAWSYVARYRAPDGTQRGETFGTLAAAKAFLTTDGADRVRGDWVDPQKGRVTFGEWSDQYLATRAHLKASTRDRYRCALDAHVLPAFDRRPVSTIDAADVEAFLSGMREEYGRGTVANARTVLSGVLGLAAKAGAVRSNVARGAAVGKAARVEQVFLTADQVEALALEVERPPVAKHARKPDVAYLEVLGLLVRTAAYTGLRAGELWALRAVNVDTMRRQLHVVESLSTSGSPVPGATKNYERRTVRLPAHLVDALAARLAAVEPDGLVFPNLAGSYVRHNGFWRRHYRPAVKRAGLPAGTNFHTLRHTCAAFLASAGLSERDVMAHLGHSHPVPTYRHLFADDHGDRIAAALDLTYAGTGTAGGATVLHLADRARS